MTNHDELCEKDKEIKELRTRVAELEKDLDDKAVSYCNGEILQLRTRLSTLLKASEGMEKALDSLVEHTIACEDQLDKFHTRLKGVGNEDSSLVQLRCGIVYLCLSLSQSR